MSRRNWAAIRMGERVRAEDIVMPDWVGGVYQVPWNAITIDFHSKWGVNMNGNLPHVCRHDDLLLTAPGMGIQCFMDVERVCMVWILRP